MLTDFPKLYCPFIRKLYKVDREDFKKYGSSLKLRLPEVYLVTPEINPGYEWVLEDEDTFAVEKLDGTNVKIKIENQRLVAVQNRKNVIDLYQIIGGHSQIVEGIFMAIQKGYISKDGEYAGEVIGPKLQGNPYQLETHLWYPFDKAIEHLRYKSFHQHARTLENWSAWFKDNLKSLLHTKKVGYEKAGMAEGVVFYNLKRRELGQVYRAKLRRDMFDWYYSDKLKIDSTPIAVEQDAID